ncbi:MAG: HDIG domain-containing protein [Candidatus Delongbacteria bacterium]|nr:HDIG domain-containing protein [Candidatus Delongbacteria bacterium]
MAWIKNCWHTGSAFIRENYLQLILLLVFSLLVSLLYPAGRSFKYTDLHVGDVSQVAIKAPVDFEVLKSQDQIRRDREAVRMTINPIFNAQDTLANYYRGTLEQMFNRLEDTTATVAPTRLPLDIDLTGLETMDLDGLIHLRQQLQRVLNALAGQFIISTTDMARLEDYQQINVVRGAIERIVPTTSLVSMEDLYSQILERLEKQYQQLEHPVGFRIGIETLRQLLQPNIYYNSAETERLVIEAVNRVPIARGFVQSGELIVDRHERITPEAMSKIRSLGLKLASRQQYSGNEDWSLLGRLLLTLIFVGLMTVYLYTSRPLIFSNLRYMSALLIVLLLILAVVRMEFSFDLGVYATPIPLLGVLLTLVFDLRVALFLLTLMALLAGSIYGNDFTYLLVAIFSGVVAAWTVRSLQRRSRLLATTLALLLAFIIANIGLNLANFTMTREVEQELLTAVINSIATPILALLLLWLLRLIFGVTSDLQLLKLGRLDHPLLRKLALAAPGTFQRTIKVGKLAEAAALGIGANPLLTRAGAYFRDLGKTLSAESFKENRIDQPDPPAIELAPVIRKHLLAGVSMARQNHLPGVIVDMIRQHHGIACLDHLVVRARTESADNEIHLTEFRYPGELPQTAESSIVMLADSVGGAVLRQQMTSIEEIEQLVDIVIQDKVSSGQLDGSLLSIRDLRGIRDAFVTALVEIKKAKPTTTGN